MTDLGDLLGIPAAPFVRRRPPRRRCRNCRRWVYVDNLVDGYGPECAAARGLVVRRWRLRTPHTAPQFGDDLFTAQPGRTAVMSTMRRFELHRDTDVIGVTGEGVVAEGVLWSDGTVTVRWLGDWPSTVQHDRGLAAVEHINCHGGLSRVVWLDPEPAAAAPAAGAPRAGRAGMSRLGLYPPPMPGGDVTRHELVAWIAANGIDADRIPDSHGITVDRAARTITVREVVDPGEPDADPPPRNGLATAERTYPLVVEPPYKLLAALTRTSGLRCGTTFGELVCNVPVDVDGHHAGNHADRLRGNAEWPNADPARPAAVDPRRYEQHAAVLAAISKLEELARAAQPGGGWYQEGKSVATSMPLLSPAEMAELHPDEFEDWVFTAATRADAAHIVAQQPARVLAALAGRRRIVERHYPVLPGRGAFVDPERLARALPGCRHCGYTWPCDDWVDAAAGLLPEEITRAIADR